MNDTVWFCDNSVEASKTAAPKLDTHFYLLIKNNDGKRQTYESKTATRKNEKQNTDETFASKKETKVNTGMTIFELKTCTNCTQRETPRQ